ncbi:siderophore ABC transporter substrate-binding protein [Hoeflea sp.]|uniref:siderophore ABC transporter substrate-binding protein n=1 Tax=Hoeflea sp. TaxID=1940281 RepID=UPI00374855A3
MKAKSTYLSTIALWMMAGCMPVHGAEIQTYAGPQSVESNPAKVAVFDVAAIDTLDALGVTIDGVPNRLYLERLQEKYAKAEVVGTLFEPDLEALNALAPDLIVVGGRSSGKQTETSRVAPSIDMTIWGEDLIGQVRQRILDYGRIFDLNHKAQALVSEFDHKIETAKNALEGKGTALVLMTNGPKISVYGPGSRFGWIHSVLGLPAADPNIDASNHGDAVSFEYVAETDPDWLIVVDRAAAVGSNEQNAKATLDNVLIRETRAWKTGRIVYLPSASVYIAAGGAQATIEVIDSLIDGFSKTQ